MKKSAEISTWRRYAISTIRIFIAGFLPTFLLSLQEAVTTGTLTNQFFLAAMFGALIAGVNLVLKVGQERYSGLV